MNCPDCAGEVEETRPDHYKCRKCGATFQQLTIFDEGEQYGQGEQGQGIARGA